MFCGCLCVLLFQCISLLFFFFSLSRQTSASPSLSRTRKRCFSHLLCRYWFKNFFQMFIFVLFTSNQSFYGGIARDLCWQIPVFCDLHPLFFIISHSFVLFARFRRRSIGCENVVHRNTSRTREGPVRCTFLLTQFFFSEINTDCCELNKFGGWGERVSSGLFSRRLRRRRKWISSVHHNWLNLACVLMCKISLASNSCVVVTKCRLKLLQLSFSLSLIPKTSAKLHNNSRGPLCLC